MKANLQRGNWEVQVDKRVTIKHSLRAGNEIHEINCSTGDFLDLYNLLTAVVQLEPNN